MATPNRNPHPEYPDRLQRFQKLMSRRVESLLLVASAYDSFILEEDGQLDELILNEFTDVSLRAAPAMQRVSSGREALDSLGEEKFDLVITTGNLGDMTLDGFVERVKAFNKDLPVVLLSFDTRQPARREDRSGDLDAVFVWQGDFRILMAIVKHIEDRWNVRADTEHMGVSVLLLIEDSVHYYSSFLPMFYSEMMTQSGRVISEGMSLTNKVMRMRARPKILLCTTYEQAWETYRRYRTHLIGVISDVEFPRNGRSDPEAGLDLARAVRADSPDLPIVLQTRDPKVVEKAWSVKAGALRKDSPVLLHELRRFMLENFGFGDFVFRLPSGEEVGRARDLRELEDLLVQVPAESLTHHATQNHFSTWLKARTEFSLAEAMRKSKASDFEDPEHMRQYLIESIHEFRRDRVSGAVAGYDSGTFDPEVSFAKIGGGSMGGKARGLAFLRQILYNYNLRNRIPGVRISVPSALVLTTDVFDQFLESNDLRDFALQATDDAEISRRFLEARFPKRGLNRIKRFLEHADYPLAVRSSSLLEDSQYLPFAGVYSTFMVPNSDENPKLRLRSLLTAVKQIYASTYFQRTKAYIRASSYRLEEEKMAVIVQRMVGRRRGRYFYPDFSGTAQSYNFYPAGPMAPEDGIACVAVGLGQEVVGGGRAIRFSPKYPRHLPQFANPADVLKHTQREFYALDFEDEKLRSGDIIGDTPARLDIEIARDAGALDAIGSIYSHENNTIYDGLSRDGSPVVTFAPILKYDRFPLAEVLELLLDVGRRALNSPVAFEFAADLSTSAGEPCEFACLQMRPMVLHQEAEAIDFEDVDEENALVSSKHVLGHGAHDDIRDIVFVDRDRFDRARSREAGAQVAEINARLREAGRRYVLIGVGRWGASDPWLGIPVTWDQISGARVIVETGFKGFAVDPSQGSHFFHNLTASSVGYFSAGFVGDGGRVDWDWLHAQPAEDDLGLVVHVRTEHPLTIRMQGHQGRGYIAKPE